MTEGLKKGWRIWHFDQMATMVNDRINDPAEANVEYYVGLEHLDPESLTIRRWGTPSDVNATKLLFRKGDIIFGRRRVYQRKLAVAHFDGICSAHALVLRAKPEVVLPEFLPFFMQSDLFMERAKQISVGSLSPTINWKTLAKEEFALPPMEEQRRIASLLELIEMTIDKLHIFIGRNFHLQQAISDREFIYENINAQSFLGDFYTRITEQVDSRDDSVSYKPLITPENISKKTGEIINNYGSASEAMSSKFLFTKGAVLYSRIRPYFKKVTIAPFDGICSTEIYPLVPNKKIIPEYLMDLLLSSSFTRYAIAGMKGTGFPRVSHDYMDKFPVKIPVIEKQKDYFNKINPLKHVRKGVYGRLETVDMMKKVIMDGM